MTGVQTCALPILRHQGLNLVQIVPVPGGKVIKTDNGLIEFQQVLQQIGADEAGHAGDQPGLGVIKQIFSERLVLRRCVVTHMKGTTNG